MFDDTNVLQFIELPEYGSFPVRGFLKVSQPVRFIHYVSSNSQGEGGGAVYGVGSQNYFVGSEYSPASGTESARLDYYLNSTHEIVGVPSSRWNEQPANTPPISDCSVLDALEAFIISQNHPQVGRGIFIHRDNEIYEVTTQGKVRVLQQAPRVA